MRVKILNWEKMNARKDVTNPSWFKFKHKFFEDSDFYDFTHEERCVWMYLLCEASKRNDGGCVTVNTQHAHRVASLSSTAINSALKKLTKLHIVECRTLRGRYADVHETGAREDKIREEEIREEKRREEKINEKHAHGAELPLESKDSFTHWAITTFCREYKRRYGVNYTITGKDKGILGRLVSDLGKPKFERLCASYVDMPDQWFLKMRHSAAVFESNIAKISQFEQSGRFITDTEINMIDRRQATANVFDKVIAEAEERERQNGKQ